MNVDQRNTWGLFVTQDCYFLEALETDEQGETWVERNMKYEVGTTTESKKQSEKANIADSSIVASSALSCERNSQENLIFSALNNSLNSVVFSDNHIVQLSF
ncbi:hypothetical protein L3X38_043518 [Prunus dulcis]|uniref:Uncharacterized protein n=1 Tax=Prunus dulcis TaxID=3755 RepID=A0AAD4UYY9_PRUDU|nr:hypothetical protein L3X38_043518 [Prunus dulcis]